MKTYQAELFFDCRALLGECIRWDEQAGMLYFVDIPGHTLHRYHPQTKAHHSVNVGEDFGCFALRTAGGFIAGLRSGYARIDAAMRTVTRLQGPAYDPRTQRFNDGRCDAVGRMWAGTMYEPRDQQAGQVWRLDPNGSLHAAGIPAIISNGIAFSPDNAWMYFADTPNHAVFRYEFDVATGTVRNGKVIRRYTPGNGRPDGATVDAEGNYYICLFDGGRIEKLSPEGSLLAEIHVPTRDITCCTFGDADLKTLYITTARSRRTAAELQQQPSAGSVFAVRMDVAGRNEYRYAG